MFSSLKVKNFRLYWVGMFISLIGTWIQSVAQSWLVFELTNSSFLLGVVGFINTLPVFLLSLLGGVAADRINKKGILFFTQNAFMILAFILAILTQFKIITTSQIMVIAVLNGIVMAFDAPARQSVIAELVGREHLLNAIALNSAAFNSARIIGPALAGIFIASIGMSGCFYLNGISFFAVILALLLIKKEVVIKQKSSNHILKDLMDGLVFIKGNHTIIILISMVAITSLFGISYVILMPVFAKEVLNSGVKGFGLLMSSVGIGALLAALMLARLGDFKAKGKLLFVSTLIFSFSLLSLALAKNYLFSCIILFFIGWSSVSAISIINTLLQILVPDRFRGRVMSAFMFTFAGIMPFGNLIAGTLAHAIGVSLTLFVSGAICSVFFISINLIFPRLKEI